MSCDADPTAQVIGPGWNKEDAYRDSMVHLLQEVNFEFFIDRDPLTYHHVLNYLRNGELSEEIGCVKTLRKEAAFLGLQELEEMAGVLPEMCR